MSTRATGVETVEVGASTSGTDSEALNTVDEKGVPMAPTARAACPVLVMNTAVFMMNTM